LTTKESVLQSLRELKDPSPTSEVGKARDEWIGALATLFSRILDWLQEAASQKLLIVEHEQTVWTEERLGAYPTPMIFIKAPSGLVITIQPKARYAAGTKGRVDIECMPKRRTIVRTDTDVWMIVDPDPEKGWRFRPLTEESFWGLIGDLLGTR
jgi:hypothetical protein